MKKAIISRNPAVMNGALVFTETRVPVEILIQHIVAGDSLDKFLEDFPTVSREHSHRLSRDDAGSSGCACCLTRTYRTN